MCALLVGLPDVAVVGAGEWPTLAAGRDRHAGLSTGVRLWCEPAPSRVRQVDLVDLPVFGRPVRLR